MSREDFIIWGTITAVLFVAGSVLVGVIAPKIDAELSRGHDAGVSCVMVDDNGLGGPTRYKVCAPPAETDGAEP